MEHGKDTLPLRKGDKFHCVTHTEANLIPKDSVVTVNKLGKGVRKNEVHVEVSTGDGQTKKFLILESHFRCKLQYRRIKNQTPWKHVLLRGRRGPADPTADTSHEQTLLRPVVGKKRQHDEAWAASSVATTPSNTPKKPKLPPLL